MDADLFAAINGLAGHSRALDFTGKALASMGPFALAALLLALWFWPGPRAARDRAQRAVLHATLATTLALLANQVIIRVWARPRPFAVLHATLMLPASPDPSFPSDHATFAFGVGVALVIANRRLGAPALVLAIAIAVARVYVGEHFPGDVVGGAAVASCAVLATRPLMPKIERAAAPILALLKRWRLA